MNTTKKRSKRIFYFDALRALAIISVIVYHINLALKVLVLKDPSQMFSLNWFIADFFDNYFRFGVDLFLMLAGALSLGREWKISGFLGKRLPRIIEPYLFWLFATAGIYLLVQFLNPGILTVVPSFTAYNIFEFILKAFQSETTYFYSYWFFWMILGTYFIMPIVNKWILHSDIKEVEYFLVFWLITSLFTFTLKHDFPVTLTYFTSPLGMVVLGYYLRHTKRKIFNSIYFPILLLIIGFVLEIGLSCIFATPETYFKFNRYSITMVIKVVGIFLLFRNIDAKNIFSNTLPHIKNIFKKAVFSIAKYSYGFYLIHLCILNLLIGVIKYVFPFERYKLLLLILFILTLAFSWILMAVLNRIPYINQIIGAK